MCIRSQITRYGDSGVVLWVSRGIHCWSHSCLSVAISWATAVRRPRGLPPSRCLTSAISASSVRAASPISAWWTGMSLARSAGIQRGLDHHLALGHRHAVVRRGEAAADAEDHVRAHQEVVELLADRAAARAERQRVVFGERALALKARRHRRLEQLGQLAELRPRLRVVDALARVDDRALGLDEHAGHFRHRLGIRAGARAERGRVGERLGHVLLEDVDGNFHEDRTRPAVLHLGEGAAHRVRHLARQQHLLAPLGDVPVVERGVEIRRDVGDPPRIAPGEHDDGDRVAVGLGHAAEAVLRARPVLHREHADLLAGADAGDGVGHVEPDALLPYDDRADVGLGGRLDDGVDGIADEERDSLALQDLRDGGGGLHVFRLLVRGLVWAGSVRRRAYRTRR